MLGRWLPDFFQHIPYQLVVFPAGKQLYFFADVNKTLLWEFILFKFELKVTVV